MLQSLQSQSRKHLNDPLRRFQIHFSSSLPVHECQLYFPLYHIDADPMIICNLLQSISYDCFFHDLTINS